VKGEGGDLKPSERKHVQSVYNWEEGKARPRAQHLPAIFALRKLGRRQANEILESRKAA